MVYYEGKETLETMETMASILVDSERMKIMKHESNEHSCFVLVDNKKESLRNDENDANRLSMIWLNQSPTVVKKQK